MAFASKELLQTAGRKRGSARSLQSLRSRSMSRPRRAQRAPSSFDTQSIVVVDDPTIEQLRRARTAFFTQKLEHRLENMNKTTAHQGTRTKVLSPMSVSSRGSHVRVERSSTRHHSDRRRRRRTRRDTDAESSTVHVYSHASDTKRDLGAAMPRSTRRASDSVVSSHKGDRRRTTENSKMYMPKSRTESLHRRNSSKDGSERRNSLYTTETVVRVIKKRSTSADAAANTRTPRPRVTR